MRILFFAETATFAHIVRSLVLAARCQEAGHEVLLATGIIPEIACNDFPITTIIVPTTAPAIFTKRILWGLPPFSTKEVDAAVTHDLAVVNSFKPDILISDFRVSTPMVAALANVPFISLTNSYWHGLESTPPSIAPTLLMMKVTGVGIADWLVGKTFSKLEKNLLKPINAVRKECGIQALSKFTDIFLDAPGIAYCDVPALVSNELIMKRGTFLGDVSWAPRAAVASVPRIAGEPIYISLGSSGDSRQLGMIVEAFAQGGYQVIASVGNGNVDLKLSTTIKKNVQILRYVDAPRLLKHCKLAITNGGSPTSYQALRAGIPVLGIVSNLDQILCMESIQKFGAGIMLRACSLAKGDIVRATREITETTAFRNKAEKLSEEFSKHFSVTSLIELAQKLICARNGMGTVAAIGTGK